MRRYSHISRLDTLAAGTDNQEAASTQATEKEGVSISRCTREAERATNDQPHRPWEVSMRRTDFTPTDAPGQTGFRHELDTES